MLLREDAEARPMWAIKGRLSWRPLSFRFSSFVLQRERQRCVVTWMDAVKLSLKIIVFIA